MNISAAPHVKFFELALDVGWVERHTEKSLVDNVHQTICLDDDNSFVVIFWVLRERWPQAPKQQHHHIEAAKSHNAVARSSFPTGWGLWKIKKLVKYPQQSKQKVEIKI